MHAQRGRRLTLAVFSILLAPTICLGAEPHSWCNTGKALIKGGASDEDTNKIIAKACEGQFAYCCSDGPTDAGSKPLRWDLACMQRAVGYAYSKGLVDGGDHCGRYAWAQGPIRNPDDADQHNFKQYFPRDFNIVSLEGNIGYLRDIEGPVAASGDVEIGSFNLNYGKRDEIALLAGGKVRLYSGTVNGTVQYGTTYQGGSTVTFFDGVRPTNPTSPSLIDFGDAKDRLARMSEALRDNYDVNGSASKMWGTVTLTGSDPELNVFQLNASQVTNTSTFTFKVPAGSAAIITVTGTNPTFKYAGFEGAPAANKLLWNFPEATSLALDSIAFAGSILAPNAAADLQNGSIRGTVVVASASRANVELYSAPFEVACRGGLCLDKTWSCSSGTAMADDGSAAGVTSEAGFLEIAGGTYRSEGVDRTTPTHRVWYSFHPARFGRKNKPLAVFFNGGPGSGTMPYLFAFNTGPKTLDPQITADIADNPNSWTEFANLLYIDAPATGFSYPLKEEDGTMHDIGNDIDRDASTFLRVLMRFLARHPVLRDNRIILVGESYGGIRATLMLQELFDYASLRLSHATEGYRDLQLSDELTSYFRAVMASATPSAAEIASKFGHQVLIEPGLVGMEQQDSFYREIGRTSNGLPIYSVDPDFPMSNCKAEFSEHPKPCWTSVAPHPAKGIEERLPRCDVYTCNRNAGWANALGEQAATKLTKIATLSSALNVSAKSIVWMNDETRKSRAYGRASTVDDLVETVDPVDLANGSNFGALNDDDNYIVLLNHRVRQSYGVVKPPVPIGTPKSGRRWHDSGMGAVTGAAFARHVRNGVKSLITVAKYDASIWSPSIPKALKDLTLMGSVDPLVALAYDKTFPNDVSTSRPGAMGLMFDTYPDGEQINVTMPTAYDSGHVVVMSAAADLRNDVRTWLAK